MGANALKPKEIAKRVEAYFDERVMTITAPGGKRRGSYRVNFQDWSMIVSCRDNIQRTHYEAHVLQQIQGLCDTSPKFLGLDGNLMFQSDVGTVRLGQRVQDLTASAQEDLADKAVAALFDVHRAGRETAMATDLPRLGASNDWVQSFVNGSDKLIKKLKLDPVDIGKDALCEFIGTPAVQFVKWDCRSGNAAVDKTDKVRWFDFEYAGVRHGAEDFAWLVADENWPIAPETMMKIIEDRFDGNYGRSWQEYKSYLEVYGALHSIKRIVLIVNSAQRKGWVTPQKALHYDDVGVNPKLGLRLCEVGQYLADQNKITEPVGKLLNSAAGMFARTIG